jgi:hypothetical protein
MRVDTKKALHCVYRRTFLQKKHAKVTPACYAGECGVKLPRAYIGMNRIFLILLFSFYSFSTFAIIIRHDVDIKEYIEDPGELPWLARLQRIGMHGLLIHPK